MLKLQQIKWQKQNVCLSSIDGLGHYNMFSFNNAIISAPATEQNDRPLKT